MVPDPGTPMIVILPSTDLTLSLIPAIPIDFKELTLFFSIPMPSSLIINSILFLSTYRFTSAV